MNGLATRNKLIAAAHQCDDAYAHPGARARIMGYGHVEDFTLPDRPFMPNFGIGNLGSPGEAQRTADTRLGLLYAKVFAVGLAVILALVALAFAHTQPLAPAQPMRTRAEYHAQARGLAPGATVELPSTAAEDCKIAMHKSVVGIIRNTTVSYHC